MTIIEDKVMYLKYNLGRGHGHRGRSFDHNGNNNEDRGTNEQKNWSGRGCDRGSRSNCSNVECYSCGKYGHYVKG